MITWKQALERAGCKPDDIIAWTAKTGRDEWDPDEPKPTIATGEGPPTGEPWFERAFDDGYGGTEGWHFTVWTAERVYFPACYDGSEWADSAPRNPCPIPTEHIGGG